MGLLDSILGAKGTTQSSTSSVVDAVMSMIGGQQGGLGGFVQQLSGKGLGDIVNSWVSTGQNMPISADQLKKGLGENAVNNLTKQTGIGAEQLIPQLTQLLPQIVDKLTPDGNVPKGDIMSQGMNLLKGLMK